MLGWINISVKLFVIESFGEDKWNLVREKLDGMNDWLSYQQYEDGVTVGMVVAACEVLGAPVPLALKLYGRWFISYVEKNGYQNLMHLLGSSLLSFLSNLNNLHIHLKHAFPAMHAPEFNSQMVDVNTIHVHYSSKREGLWPIVQGIIEIVAESYYNKQVTVEMIKEEKGENVFFYTLEVKAEGLNAQEASVDTGASRSHFSLDKENFFKLFPFHLVLKGSDLTIDQVGFAVERILGSHLVGQRLTQGLKIVSPRSLMRDDITVQCLIDNDETNVILAGRATSVDDMESSFEMKGQIAQIDADTLLFLGYPVVRDYEEMKKHKLYLSDIPLHDGSRDMVLALEHHKAERGLKQKFEKLNLELKVTTESLAKEKARSEELLYQMLPPYVVSKLKNGETNTSQEHPDVTILFSDIVGFTRIGSSVEPSKVFAMLNELYTKFDAALEEFPELYKVETIGDAYMIVANLRNDTPNHAEKMVEFGVRMHKLAKSVMNPATGDPLSIKVGLHSGPVCSGVVGIKMPRFCFFGDTVNTASRMESNSISSFVHISDACYARLRFDYCKYKDLFIERSLEVKGKGMMTTYLLDCNERRPRTSHTGHSPMGSSKNPEFAS